MKLREKKGLEYWNRAEGQRHWARGRHKTRRKLL